MAAALLKQPDDERYAKLKLSIRDQFTFGMDVYRNTPSGAYDLLENHSTSQSLHPERKKGQQER